MSRPRPSRPLQRLARGWPAVVAVVILTGMAGGLVWLSLGVLAVRRHRTRSRPADDDALTALVDQLLSELGCRRPVELRESDDLVTAATVGSLRPCILLPRDWASWTAEQRRAVLAHELAHVCRNDFLAVLAGQLGVVLHFYNPLLHWLMGRLRLEQELAADAAAASVSGGRRQYLVAIAEACAGRQDRPLAWPARTIFPASNTLLRRITVLRQSRLCVGGLSPALRGLVVAVVAACGLLVAGLRGPGVSAPALAADDDKKASAERLDLYGDPIPGGAVTRLGTIRYRGPGEDEEIAFTPDGKMLTFANGNSLFSFGNINNPNVCTLGSPAPASSSASLSRPRASWGISRLSSDGKTAAFAGEQLNPERTALVSCFNLFDLQTGRQRALEDLGRRSGTVGFPLICLTADGTKLIAANPDGTLTVRDLATNKEIARSSGL